jgi:hypothetical protein
MIFFEAFNETVTLAAFVAVMMIMVEYINIITHEKWKSAILASPWKQYVIAGLLGVTPGCLGGFILVTLYSHRMLTLGAVITGMIATTGDESFIMLAKFPCTALFLMLGLFILGIFCGYIFDAVAGKKQSQSDECELEIHSEDRIVLFSGTVILSQWKKPIAQRGILTGGIIVFIVALVSGRLGEPEFDWEKLTILFVSLAGLFIVATVPDHFLEEHLWRHIILKHFPPIFLWTFGCLLAIGAVQHFFHLDKFISENQGLIILIAGVVGLIPISGPHLLFVMMFAGGKIPFSILVTNSIIQDGHCMLPMLAYSRKDFIIIKAVKFILGLAAGFILMTME